MTVLPPSAVLRAWRVDVEVAALVRTLRWVANHLFEDVAPGDVPDEPAAVDWARHYREVADLLERHGLAALEDCCPACEEVVCDEDCPLAGVREGL